MAEWSAVTDPRVFYEANVAVRDHRLDLKPAGLRWRYHTGRSCGWRAVALLPSPRLLTFPTRQFGLRARPLAYRLVIASCCKFEVGRAERGIHTGQRDGLIRVVGDNGVISD